MSDTTIDEIFAEFGRKCSPVATLKNVDNPLVRREYIDQAKSALYELMLSVIGEDEPLRDDEQLPSNTLKRKNQVIKARNNVRQQQRNKLKELMK